MNLPDSSDPELPGPLHELEKAIERLQKKLDALDKSLKDIKSQLERKPKKRPRQSPPRNECIPLPYTFYS